MIKIPVLSTTESTIHAVSVMAEEFHTYYEVVFFDSCRALDSYYKENLPELVVLDLTDSSLGGEDYLDSMKHNPAYYCGGVIAVVSDEGARMALEMEPNQCLLLAINEREFLRNCTRLFKIIRQNVQFIFNRYIQAAAAVREIGIFICDNDSFDIIMYTNLLITYLANTGRLDFEGKFQLQTALMEMLLNALEHGNCCINYDDKTMWLENGGDMLELIAERNKNPAVSSKKIRISYEACADETHFSIEDEGEGFDWQEMLKRDIEPKLHGMGIKMTERMVKSLTYNEKGNHVFFSISNANKSDFLVMHEFDIKNYAAGDFVTATLQSASDDDLFFILKGSVEVFSGTKLLDVRYPADVLAGKSLLSTSDSRDFALRAKTDSQLMRIKQSDFDEFLKRNPVFKIFVQRATAHSYL